MSSEGAARGRSSEGAIPAVRTPEANLLFWSLFGLLTLLGQEAFYKVDGQNLVAMLARGEGGHPLHPLFFPLVQALTALPMALGMSAFGALELVSAFGVALGVFCVHRVALRVFGGERGKAFAAALLVAGAPSLLFFGTVVEFHGLFFGCAGLFFWAYIASRRSRAWPLLVPLLSALSAGVHATGHLLLLFVVWDLPRTQPRPKRWKWILPLHFVFFGFFSLLFKGPGHLGSWDYLSTLAHRVWDLLPGLQTSWPFIQEEWFRPFFPLSILVFFGFFGRAWREAASFTLVLFLFLLFSFFSLGDQAERGAYLLPLLLPASILALRHWPRPLLVLVILLSLAGGSLGLQDIHRHDKPRRIPGFPQGSLQLTGGKARLFLGDLAEAESLLRHRPELPYVPFYELLASLEIAERGKQPAQIQSLNQALFGFLDQDLKKGTVILWTPSCLATLTSRPRIRSWQDLATQLEERYRFEPLRIGGFKASLVLPRSPLLRPGTGPGTGR